MARSPRLQPEQRKLIEHMLPSSPDLDGANIEAVCYADG
jgi:hypothetical protein